MTPCEKLGYKVGDRFRILNNNKDSDRVAGDFLIIQKDDGDHFPRFLNERTQETIPVMVENVKKISDRDRLKTGDEITQDGKKYRVTLEEIPQYDFKPGMICRVDWSKADASCVMHSDCDKVVFLENSRSGREEIAYAETTGGIAIGYVNTSSLRPE